MPEESALALARRLTARAAEGEVSDLAPLLARRGAFDQNLTVTVFAYFEVQACKHDLSVATDLRSDSSIPQETARRLAHKYVSRHVGVLERRYDMVATSALMSATAAQVGEGESLADIVEVVEAAQEYLHFLGFLIMTELPWNEMAAAYEGAKRVRQAMKKRMVP